MKTFLRNHPKTRDVIFFLSLSLGLTLLIEIMGHRSLFGAGAAIIKHPLLFLLNTGIVAFTLSFAHFFAHRNFALAMISLFWLALGGTNCVLMCIRNSPLCAVDFYILSTGFSIITVYLTLLQILLIAAALILAVVGMVLMYRKIPKSPKRTKIALVQTLASALLITALTFTVRATGEVPNQFDDITEAYKEFGFAYCFTQTLFDRGIDKPEEFSESGVEDILASLNEASKETADARPNIVIVQLESFFDLNAVQGVTLSENPVPYFTYLKQTYPSGFLTVPSIGGGTANTEFEVLSGMSLDYFGIGEFPYNTVLKNEAVPSFSYILKNLGYTSHVFHNHEGSFYDRHEVYPNLGFDTFTSIEYMNNYGQNSLGWCDDSILTKELLAAMRSTETPDFLFAVSVQCHGKYPTSYTSPKNGITVKGIKDQALEAQYRYYADQLREVDDFLRELTAALSVWEEPVVLVLYGDHLPSLDLTKNDLPSNQTLYQTEYVIWTNTASPEPVREDLFCYQLGAYALNYADIHDGVLTKLHQTSRGLDTYQHWLHTLQYDMLYGPGVSLKENGGVCESADMTMGFCPITLTSAQNAEGGFYVFGSGFTKHSVVQINGWNASTEYISDTMLFVRGSNPSEGDKIRVAQISQTGVALSYTNPVTVTE